MITTLAGKRSSAIPGHEKEARSIRRMPGDTFGPLRLATESLGSLGADVHDISVIGIGLIVASGFHAQSHFVVEAGPHGRKPSHALTAVVRNARQRADGRWLLGCSFSRPLTVDDIEALG